MFFRIYVFWPCSFSKLWNPFLKLLNIALDFNNVLALCNICSPYLLLEGKLFIGTQRRYSLKGSLYLLRNFSSFDMSSLCLTSFNVIIALNAVHNNFKCSSSLRIILDYWNYTLPLVEDPFVPSHGRSAHRTW